MIKIQLNPLKSSQVFQKSIRFENLHRICCFFSTELPSSLKSKELPVSRMDPNCTVGKPWGTGNQNFWCLEREITLINVGLEFSEHWIHGTETTISTILLFQPPLLVFWEQNLRCFFRDCYRRFLGPAKQAIAAIPVAPLVVALVGAL